jgi:DNA-binding GntR family transcriptional regulator
LREAFKVLSAEGLVELLPNRGARVVEFREQDMREAFEVMATLEGLAGRLAVVNATDDEIAEIRAMHYQMYAHYLRRELAPYFELNRRIHARIVQVSRNTVLQAHLVVLSRRVAHARYADWCWTDEFWASAMKEHDNILEFLMQRDGDQLARQLHAHLINKLQSMIEGFRRKAQAEEQAPAQVQPLRRARKRLSA